MPPCVTAFIVLHEQAFEKPGGHLQMALGLHETAHHTEGAVQISISISSHARYDGMVRALVWRHTVRVVLI